MIGQSWGTLHIGSFRVKWSSGCAGTDSDLAHSVIFALFGVGARTGFGQIRPDDPELPYIELASGACFGSF